MPVFGKRKNARCVLDLAHPPRIKTPRESISATVPDYIGRVRAVAGQDIRRIRTNKNFRGAVTFNDHSVVAIDMKEPIVTEIGCESALPVKLFEISLADHGKFVLVVVNECLQRQSKLLGIDEAPGGAADSLDASQRR